MHLLESSPSPTLQWGAIVEDVDDPEGEMVVVSTPGATAIEWDVPVRDRTVAEDNPAYPPTDPVIVTVYKDQLEQEWPYYGGHRPLSLSDIGSKYGLKAYSFPESRLRVVGRLSLPRVPIEDVRPSPYHSRSFSVKGNEEFIETTRKAGVPLGSPLVREMDGYFEIINGHKRLWVSQAAGLDEIPVQVLRCDDRRAADLWVKHHFHTYDQEQQQAALNRLIDDFGMGVFDELHHLERPEWLADSRR